MTRTELNSLQQTITTFAVFFNVQKGKGFACFTPVLNNQASWDRIAEYMADGWEVNAFPATDTEYNRHLVALASTDPGEYGVPSYDEYLAGMERMMDEYRVERAYLEYQDQLEEARNNPWAVS
jgi:hypothetical protein